MDTKNKPEEKELKDHKQIGQELELFFTNEIAPGAPFWLPKGMVIFKELEKYIREITEKAGYQETSTPIMVKSELFRQSGHWDKFGKDPFDELYNLSLWEEEDLQEITKAVKEEVAKLGDKHKKAIGSYYLATIFHKGQKVDSLIAKSGDAYVPSLPVNYTLKPMNCPESTVLYRFRNRSYRELPLRFSEIGRLHRREKSGEVNGLLRVRQLTMDDAHIYAREDQIFDEVGNILDMMINFYKGFGFEFDFRLATRPELFAGTEENWKRAEEDLEKALKLKKLKYTLKPKDGAFYGPKIDVHIKDTLGREWQLATVQLDFHQPQAFNLTYADSDGTEKQPVMIHRAIFGSFERFIAILTEQYQGAFPLWLSPVQIAILPISDKVVAFAEKVAQEFADHGIRVEVDSSSQTLGGKIRTHTLQKVPYLSIIGEKEVEKSQSDGKNYISVRQRDGKDLGTLDVKTFISDLQKSIEKRI